MIFQQIKKPPKRIKFKCLVSWGGGWSYCVDYHMQILWQHLYEKKESWHK